MKQMLKKTLLRTFPSFMNMLIVYKRLYRNRNSYLNVTGWLETNKRGFPCKEDGSPLPWMNFSLVSFLEKRLQKDMRIFEYGSGYSTLFFANLVQDVVSVEYDQEWYERVKSQMPHNVTLLYQPQDDDGAYCRTIHAPDHMFDLVIVDGSDRINCVKQSFAKLSQAGVILLDDSSRGQYRAALDYATARGYRSLDIEGLKPTGESIDRTTIIYRDGNCLSI